MKLAIVRHGKAHAQSSTGRDRDRPLLPRGEAQARWLGEALRDFAPVQVFSSPYERAITTARIMNQALQAPLEAAQELICDEPASRAVALLERFGGTGPLVLVGHNPQLSSLVALLIGGAGARSIELRTGEAALLEVEGSAIGTAKLLDTLRLAEE